MRPIYWQLAALAVVIVVVAIVRMYNKIETLEAQIKKVDALKPRPLTNSTVVNTPFKPQNPSA